MPVGVNLDKPHRWKADIAESVRAYNQWFLANAPKAFREQRDLAIAHVDEAMNETHNLTRIDASTLEDHPGILPSLRMATCPPLARDRLVGLAGVKKGLVRKMEKKAAVPSRMRAEERHESLERISNVIARLLDSDICPWVAEARLPVDDEAKIAAMVIADRLCGTAANPIIRNAQETRQLEGIERWLEAREYVQVPAGDAADPGSMPAGSFAFRMNVEGWVDEHGATTVNIPVDAVVKPRGAASGELPLFIEAKSAGDFTNVNKRRKEEAVKAGQLRKGHGPDAQFILFLGGYFDSGYLGYEAAEGIDWVWEHRIDDFSGFGL